MTLVSNHRRRLCVGCTTLAFALSFPSLAAAQQSGAPAQPQSQPAPQAAQPADATQSAPQGQGQAPDSDQNGVFVFKKTVDEVMLHATAVDSQGRLITNLQRNQFRVLDNGKPQEIASFRREDVPIALGVVVDNSGSMRDKREKVNQAVLNLIKASDSSDEIFVVNFAADYYLDQDFTSNYQLLQSALQQGPMKGSTALYDAIVASADHIEKDGRLEKKVLLIITDGEDNISQSTLKDVEQHLQQKDGPTVYVIGLLGDNLRHPAREPLAELASSTGGVAYFPSSVSEVDNITKTIARDLRSQYMIGYKPTDSSGDPQFRDVKVMASATSGPVTVRSRRGYYPPPPSENPPAQQAPPSSN